MSDHKRALKIIKPAPKQTDTWTDERGKERIRYVRGQLLAAAVRYVRDGKDGSRAEGLRTASDLAGIPIGIIESEMK